MGPGIPSLAGALVAFSLAIAPSPPATGPAEAGRSHFFAEATSVFDRWTKLGAGCRPYYARYYRLRLYPPSSDACVHGGYGGGLGYADIQAIYKRADGSPRHPEWVLKDDAGRNLFVPFGCAAGTCSQYAADIGNRAFRSHYIDQIRRWPAEYRGIFIDDVNWNLNVGDGSGSFVRPIDPRTGAPMTDSDWRRYMADFLEQIKAAFPGKERMINTVWWKPESNLDDPDVRRGVRAATGFDIERGSADIFSGQSYPGMLAYIDRLHSLGLVVNLDSYATSRELAEFEMATYFLISAGQDSYATNYRYCPETGSGSPCTQSWWSAYDTDLGPPLGPATLRSDGVFSRLFADGLVLVNPPGAETKAVLPGLLYTNLDGLPVFTVTLNGGQAVVLRQTI